MALFDILRNPATGKLSHSKVWANVACAVSTYKFFMLPEPSVEIWATYLGIVGGYAVARAAVSVKRQEVEAGAVHDAG